MSKNGKSRWAKWLVLLVVLGVAAGGHALPTPQAIRVRTGITDGTSTEITAGLKEGGAAITSVRLPAGQTAAAPAGRSPFGGPPRFR